MTKKDITLERPQSCPKKWGDKLTNKNQSSFLSSPIFQIIVILIGVIAYYFDAAAKIQDWGMSIAPNSIYLNYWKSLPATIYVKYYFFNVTNPEEFLNGSEKLRVEEIGPFVYAENWLINNVTFNDNKTLTYNPVRVPVFQREMSVGDPKEMVITTANIPYLGVASLLANKSYVSSYSFMYAARLFNSKPFVNLTIDEISWGYDDPLIKLAHTFVSSWIPIQRFGILDRIYDEGVNWVTIFLEDNGLTPGSPGYLPQYTIDKFNGITGLPQWGNAEKEFKNREQPLQPTPSERCKLIRGGTESLLFPRHMDTRIVSHIYRKPFCRSMPVEFKKQVTAFPGIYSDRYEMPDEVFGSPWTNEAQRCFCKPETQICPPRGFTDIAPCFYKIPLTLSLPHFQDVDEDEMNNIEGMLPNKSRHLSYVEIQPKLGIVTDVKERIQLNLWIKNVSHIGSLAPLASRNFPLLWVELVPSDLPMSTILLLYLLLWILPVLQLLVILIGILAFFVLFFNLFKNWREKKLKSSSDVTS